MVKKLPDAICRRAVERASAGNQWDERRKGEMQGRRAELQGRRVELDARMNDVSSRISLAMRGDGHLFSSKLKAEWDVLVSELRTLTAEVAGIDESILFHEEGAPRR